MKRFIKPAVCGLLLICIILAGCYGFNSAHNTTRSDFGFGLEDFNCPLDDSASSNQSIFYADEILNGNMYVQSMFKDPLPYTLENFNWNVQFTNSPNTFQLYLQCLTPLAILSHAYELTEETKYLEYGEKLLDSWIASEKQWKKSPTNPYVWYDHGTALRAEHLIYFTIMYERAGLSDNAFRTKMRNLLERHALFLYDDTNYTKNHNHGIFQDRALLYLAYFLQDEASETWAEHAKKRLSEQESFAFNEELVHVENSPGYQVGVMELFTVIGDFLVSQHDPFGEELVHNIEQSAEFMAWIYKPNGYLAEVGDTSGGTQPQQKNLSIYHNNRLTWAASLGNLGEMPDDQTSAWFPKSGYYFYRQSWEKESLTDSTWKMFKAGYSSKTHKHADDLSFLLYSKGYDIFVDSGWYNYMTGDPYRDYFISSKAHNTVIVDGKTYSATETNSWKTGMLGLADSEGLEHVLAFNDMYDGVQIDRHFYSLGDLTILYDDIVSEDTHTYSQLFHLSENMSILEKSDTEVLIALADTGYRVRIRQMGAEPSLITYRGDKSEMYGHISRAMNQLDEIDTLKFDLTGNRCEYVTVITIEDGNGYVRLDDNGADIQIHQTDIQFDPVLHSIVFASTASAPYNSSSIQLSQRQRFTADHVQTTVENNELLLQNLETGDGLSYAWYLVDWESAKVFYNAPYSGEPSLSYSLDPQNTPNRFLVKAYVMSSQGQRKSSVVAVIERDEVSGHYQDVTSQHPYLNLRYHGQEQQQLPDSSYRFQVLYDYSWKSNIQWYIYRNGGYYASYSTANGEPIICQFQEPGTYTVMYYLRTPNGDNEFWNFPRIILEG